MQSSRLICLGLNHRTTAVEVREHWRCSLRELASVQCQFTEFSAIREFALLSTCNRLELYAAIDPAYLASAGVAEYSAEADRAMEELLSSFLLHGAQVGSTELKAAERHANRVDLAEFEHPSFYFYADLAVMEHLAEVAAGLDSLVLGEAQILGQVTAAYRDAVAQHTAGPTVDALLRAAIRTGKRARHETAISTNPASIPSIAIAKARQACGRLQNQRIVVIGLGEMGRLTLKALAARNLKNVAIVNRTPAKAAPFVEQGHAIFALTQLDAALSDADIVISATSAPSYILDAARIAQLQTTRNARPLVLVDIALPRNIDPAAGGAPGVQLFDLDALNAGLDEALAARRCEVPHVRTIIDEEVAHFAVTLRELAMRPVVVDLRQQAEQIRRQELARALHYLGDDVDDEVLVQMQHLSRILVNRLLHAPTARLREVAHNGHADIYAAAVRDLFDLSDAAHDTHNDVQLPAPKDPQLKDGQWR